ncbi:putative hydro-lyase [Microbulbifer hainanensis]|uniref:putative hydro-lyase n=1 Tax=Microbulbifer hainanensis TaxID=2735675 RepID=UPI0018663ADB|nr:DUF1445 domain-containing protein [Microbulbifer hainanensis]
MIRQCSRVIREEIRAERLKGPTSGLAAGFVQTGIAVLPAEHADQFADFCAKNPRACTLLLRSKPGVFAFPSLGEGVDVRCDLPRYQIHRRGQPAEEVLNVRDYWRSDLVTFFLGCSFSFEEALLSAGHEVRNITLGRNVPMYHTNRQATSVGPFAANLVVSMRPFAAAQLDSVEQISGRFPLVHGAPVFSGDPAELGIANLDSPDFGEPVPLAEGETPVFWASDVTACEALRNAELDFCITHCPGHMLICDRQSRELENITDPGQLNWD